MLRNSRRSRTRWSTRSCWGRALSTAASFSCCMSKATSFWRWTNDFLHCSRRMLWEWRWTWLAMRDHGSTFSHSTNSAPPATVYVLLDWHPQMRLVIVAPVCLSVLFMLSCLKPLSQKLNFWHSGTSSEYLGEFFVSRWSDQGQCRTSNERVIWVKLNIDICR